jgi:RNase P subunit RPR2
MPPSVPADDHERLQLSGARWASVGIPALLLGTMTFGAVALIASGRDGPLGAVVLAVVLLAAGVGWRWGTPLRGVVATRTGLLVTDFRGECFVPYELVASARENRLQRYRPITVTLNEPVGGMDRFVFVPPWRLFLSFNDAHPSAVELARRLPRPRCDECGSPFTQGTAAIDRLCAECAHLLYGYPACQHDLDSTGSCSRCGWDQSRSQYTASLARSGSDPRQ